MLRRRKQRQLQERNKSLIAEGLTRPSAIRGVKMGKTPLFVGGYIPDKKDKRDFPATKLLVKTVALPETFVVNDGTLIYNQGSIPKCVASTGAGVKTDQEFLQYGKQIKFDDD